MSGTMAVGSLPAKAEVTLSKDQSWITSLTLAMTMLRTCHILSRHHPPPGRRNAPPDGRLQRMIQYSETLGMETRGRGVLDTRLRGHDDGS
jgi:hypothetical protein